MTDEIVKILLRDHTTDKNIIWATSERSTQEILPSDVENIIPRWQKDRFEQKNRTRARAEIFTPPEVCEIQNNLVIGDTRDLEKFIDARFLEITCGEAPYITSRYNAATGEAIDFDNRVGILDKKLKIIGNETETVEVWTKFAIRALQSVYGYEFQGDNLFLARRNIFDSIVENFTEKFPDKLPKNFLFQVAYVISWNFWQMDGRTNSPPFTDSNRQTEFNFYGDKPKPNDKIFCEIFDWQAEKRIIFKNLLGGARK